jgi:hypothetical protein
MPFQDVGYRTAAKLFASSSKAVRINRSEHGQFGGPRMKTFLLKTILAGCGLLMTSELAHADIIFTLGNNPSDEVNILLNSGANGTNVQGSPNGLSGFLVNFTSTQGLLLPSSGHARVSANPEGTPLTNLSISLANGGSYGDLILNPFVGGPGVCALCTGGTATMTVNAISSSGLAEPAAVFTYTLGSGNNFLTILASGGESIVSTSISAPGGFNDLRQPRISGPFQAPPIATPEPGSLSLLACGLLGVALYTRKSRAA